MDTFKQWSYLKKLTETNPIPGLHLDDSAPEAGVRVLERWQNVVMFDYIRYFSGGRRTITDLTGLVGLCSCDFSKREVTLTEGVSDFISVKCFHGGNVLGRSHLTMSHKQRAILSELFDKFNIVIDNDSTGYKTIPLFQDFLRGKQLNFIKPSYPYKDITQQLLSSNFIE